MKIRNGFVSNSSSSSFIVYGVNLSLEESSQFFNYDNYYKYSKENNIIIEEDRYYFDGDLEGYIIGFNGPNFEDGQVVEINLTDEYKQQILDKIETLGIKKNLEDVKIYIQFVSNDNY